MAEKVRNFRYVAYAPGLIDNLLSIYDDCVACGNLW